VVNVICSPVNETGCEGVVRHDDPASAPRALSRTSSQPCRTRTSNTLSVAAVTVDTFASTTATARATTPRNAGQSGGQISTSGLGVASNSLLMTAFLRQVPGRADSRMA
jgi:hypothetical protein